MMDWEIRKLLTFVKCSIACKCFDTRERCWSVHFGVVGVEWIVNAEDWQLEKMRYRTIILFVGHSNILDKDSDERKRTFNQNFGVRNKEYLWYIIAFSVVVKKSYLVGVICEWNERIEWWEKVSFFQGSEVAMRGWKKRRALFVHFQCCCVCFCVSMRVAGPGFFSTS